MRTKEEETMRDGFLFWLVPVGLLFTLVVGLMVFLVVAYGWH